MATSSSTTSGSDMASAFAQKYQAWKSYIARSAVRESSSDEAYIDNAPFREIVALGREAIPFIIATLQRDPDAHFLVHALPQLTGKHFSAKEIETAKAEHGSPLGNQGYARMWIDWWKQEGKK